MNQEVKLDTGELYLTFKMLKRRYRSTDDDEKLRRLNKSLRSTKIVGQALGLLVSVSLRLTALTPLTYQRHSLRRALLFFKMRDLILGGVSHLDAFSVYLVPT